MDADTFRVILAPSAIQDLADAVIYIAADNPRAAERFGQALIDQTKILGQFPNLGRPVPELADQADAREIIYRTYRILYRVNYEQKVVEVSRYWNAARGTPPNL